jgi:hypothetical protein
MQTLSQNALGMIHSLQFIKHFANMAKCMRRALMIGLTRLDSLPSLCSDSDPEDMDQQDADELELSLVYGKIEDDDPIPQDDTEVGSTDYEELEEALLTLADNSMIKGASIEPVTELRELLITYKNSFRLRMGQDPPAKVRPLVIELKPDA